MDPITGWLSNQILAGLVIFLALVGLACGPIATYQHFEIAGVHLHIGKLTLLDIPGLRVELQNAARDLKQARVNEDTLKASIKKQNDALKKKSDDDAARLAEAAKEVADAQARAKLADAKLQAFLAYKPVGNTQAEQLLDEVRHYQESLP